MTLRTGMCPVTLRHQPAFDLLRDVDALLEYVPGDDPAAVASEGLALRRRLAGA